MINFPALLLRVQATRTALPFGCLTGAASRITLSQLCTPEMAQPSYTRGLAR